MAILNRKICVVAGGANTGFGDCVLSFGKVEGAFLVPRNKQFTPAELEDFQATLTDLAKTANARDRIFPIHHFEEITDNTEELTIQTVGYGGKYPTNEGDYDWTFQFFQGGICLLKSLQSHNGSGKAALFYDSNGVIFGQKNGENLAGVPLTFFWADKWRPSDGTNASVYAIRFVFRPRYINQDLGFVDVDFNPSNIEGLEDVNLREAAGSAVPELKIKAFTGCAAEDLYDTYSTELAAVGAWTATIDGATVAISSVAEDEALKAWTVTLDDADPNYDANGTVVVSLADPEALDLLGVSGFESKPLTIG